MMPPSRTVRINCILMLLVAAAILTTSMAQAKTCLMLYQMADNDLETFIRSDYQELTGSPVLQDSDLRTWVYHDARNTGGGALPNTVDQNGNPLSGSFTGSMYITYDPSIGSMKVDSILPGEQNSDTIASVQNFLQRAISDCIANGHTSLFAVFASHGGGFFGYGGDTHRPGRQLFVQTNRDVASGIRNALTATVGAEKKLDVLGFDACSMQAFGAADDYKSVAHNILASEFLEPGHGWAYLGLQTAPDALTLATQVVESYLGMTQGTSAHLTPKQLSILDTTLFETFVAAFDTFCGELLAALPGDESLHTFVARSQSSAVTASFLFLEAGFGAAYPIAFDLGSFLFEFKFLCNPGGTLGTALAEARNAYEAMFVINDIAPGTKLGTGMHIVWPYQTDYSINVGAWNGALFDNPVYATTVAPNYGLFLRYFLTAGVQGGGADASGSVCQMGAQPLRSGPEILDGLIYSSSGTEDESGNFVAEAEIATSVNQILVEYSIDLTTPLKPFLERSGYEPQEGEYLFLKGGNVLGSYASDSGSTFSATWDRNFYFLNITSENKQEAMYVTDNGNGEKEIAVMYFPEANRSGAAELQLLDFLFVDFDNWFRLGARYGALKFSVDEAVGRVNDNLILYTSRDDGTAAEEPPESKGLIVPLMSVDAFIQGRYLSIIAGGFNQTIIEWGPSLDYHVLTTSAEQVFNRVPETDAIVMVLTAYDRTNVSNFENKTYDVIRPFRSIGEGDVDVGIFAGPEDTEGLASGCVKHVATSSFIVLGSILVMNTLLTKLV